MASCGLWLPFELCLSAEGSGAAVSGRRNVGTGSAGEREAYTFKMGGDVSLVRYSSTLYCTGLDQKEKVSIVYYILGNDLVPRRKLLPHLCVSLKIESMTRAKSTVKIAA